MKRKNIIVLMISLSLVLLLGSSYALLRSSQVGKNPYVINVGTLEVTFVDSETKFLNLTNMYPMSDKEGMNQSKELEFVVKNTGNIAARYNVYLEETSTNPEFKNYIRFISNKNSEGYNEPKTMGYDKYIDLEARLDNKDELASYKVKIWLGEDAGNEYMDETFTAKVVVESNQVDTSNTLYTKINNEITKHSGTTIEEDGITYLSGSNDEVNYNYVWYSGKLWRITAINDDGTIKMITQNNITSIHYNLNAVYKDSWIWEWLNEDFLDTLYNHQNIIDDNVKWNATRDDSETPVKPSTDVNATLVSGKVGLLNAYEYYRVYENASANNYLNIGYIWWLLNPASDTYIWRLGTDGVVAKSTVNTNALGVRPVIYLKPNIQISGGDGSKNDPYRLLGDKETGKKGERINTRLSGEYIKIDDIAYRIIGIENNTTKLISADYLKEGGGYIRKIFGNTENYSDSVNSKDSNNIGYYLNNVWLNANLKKYITDGTYYLGTLVDDNYKKAICDANNLNVSVKDCIKVNDTWTGLIGLPRVGEMFATSLENYSTGVLGFYLLTKVKELFVWRVNPETSYLVGTSLGEYKNVRPTIHLKSDVIITDGDGMTPETAYTIDLPE